MRPYSTPSGTAPAAVDEVVDDAMLTAEADVRTGVDGPVCKEEIQRKHECFEAYLISAKEIDITIGCAASAGR